MSLDNGEFDDIQQFSNRRTASDMLEDALHHFDNIIDRTALNGNTLDKDDADGKNTMVEGEFNNGLEGVALLMEDLRNAVEATIDAEVADEKGRADFADALLHCMSPGTLTFYRKLLKVQMRDSDSSDVANKLQMENESLSLQVSVLNDQVELQTEKLREIEAELSDALARVEGADARLQEEVAAKTNLETQKLQLLNEVSNCKISLAQRQRQTETDLAEIRKQKLEVESCAQQLKQELDNKDKIIEELRERVQAAEEATPKVLASPDEGIVSDQVDKEQRIMQLRMPVPFATSTPIAQDSGPTTSTERENLKKKLPSDMTSPTTSVGREPASKQISQSFEKLDSVRPMETSQDVSSNLPQIGASPLKPIMKSPPQSSKATKSSSTPNLAMTELRPSSLPSDTTPARLHPQPSPFHQRKKHGFKKFFTSFKLRRSRSTSLEPRDDDRSSPNPPAEQKFQRGGVRSTAGARLGWNPREQVNQSKSTQSIPFQQWDCGRVCQWLVEIGLYSYEDACRKWIKSGDTLVRATNHELEKDLGMRNPLHKKKLMLHLQSLAGGKDEDYGGTTQMDAVWTARWLDDIGLPQYKDSFHDACMDGITLHHLTVTDAQKLKITNLFHLISLRRGIEKLRECQFDPSQLRRRPVPEGESDDVSLWTNHRVMEWLRSADLSEYAPNLRGSGVHGALMVLEPLFTAEILASLLNIPASKSLLRRHLASKLEELLPEESIRLKRDRSKEQGHQPLNIAAKYKVGRRSFGAFGRFRSAATGSSVREFGSGEYVCPMTSSKTMTQHRKALESKMQLAEVKKEEGRGNSPSVPELDEKAALEINAFSKEITTLTNKWAEE